jgi:hypothetical protein
VWKNKEGENCEVVRNKARFVAQEFIQKEEIDYEETFALVARSKATRILLAFSVAKGFKLHQMDVKSAFLNGVLEQGLRKALYRLKQTLSGIHPGYSCKEGRKVEDRLLLEFPCNSTRTRSM